jgi:hypothetical protein
MLFAGGKMNAAEVSVSAFPRPPARRARSSNWTLNGGLAKNFDTPPGGSIQGAVLSAKWGLEELLAPGLGIFPAARGLGIAPGNPAADRDFRREQAAQENGGRGKHQVEAGGNVVAKPLGLEVQEPKSCCDDARTVFPTCHGILRSLFRA